MGGFGGWIVVWLVGGACGTERTTGSPVKGIATGLKLCVIVGNAPTVELPLIVAVAKRAAMAVPTHAEVAPMEHRALSVSLAVAVRVAEPEMLECDLC